MVKRYKMNAMLNELFKSKSNDHALVPPWYVSTFQRKEVLATYSMLTFLLFFSLIPSKSVFAQNVDVSVSYDTVYIGNVLGVQYSMEDWQGDLTQPDFGEFDIVGGPQMRSSMSYSGGKRTSSKAIIFYLKPPDHQGVYQLPSQTFRGEGEEALTEEKEITVLENPDRIEQNPSIEKKPSRSFNKQYKRGAPPHGQRQRF